MNKTKTIDVQFLDMKGTNRSQKKTFEVTETIEDMLVAISRAFKIDTSNVIFYNHSTLVPLEEIILEAALGNNFDVNVALSTDSRKEWAWRALRENDIVIDTIVIDSTFECETRKDNHKDVLSIQQEKCGDQYNQIIGVQSFMRITKGFDP